MRAQTSAVSLIERFRERAGAAGGRVGAVILGPGGRAVLALDPDSVYPAASVIKLPLVMTLYADAHEGRLSLDERVAVGERVDGSGVLRDLRDVSELSLRDLAALAITVSDNTATNRLIERVGIERVTARLDEWGCPRTRLRRRTFDWEARSRGLENEMVPRETASLLARVDRGAADGVAASVAVLDLLRRNANVTRLGRYLPADVGLAHKDGWGDDPDPVENDAGIVAGRPSVVVVGFTHRVPTLEARPLLGLLGLAAAEVAGVAVPALPLEALAGS